MGGLVPEGQWGSGGRKGLKWVRKDCSLMKFEGNKPDQSQTQFFLSRLVLPGCWMLPSGTNNIASTIFLHQPIHSFIRYQLSIHKHNYITTKHDNRGDKKVNLIISDKQISLQKLQRSIPCLNFALEIFVCQLPCLVMWSTIHWWVFSS